jgi:replicative DNA helicase
MVTRPPTSAHLAEYCAIVRELWIRRRLIGEGMTLIRRAHECDGDKVESLLDEAAGRLAMIGEFAAPPEDTMRPLKDGLLAAIDTIELTYKHRGHVTGVPTGFHDLDRMTGGFKPGQFVILAARPAMGKTAMAMNLAIHAAQAERMGGPVAFFSLEMTFEELATRALCTEAELNLQRVRDGFLSAQKMDALPIVGNRLAGTPLYIDDTAALSIQEFRRRARVAVKKRGVKLIVIDYLQLMKSSTRRAEGNRVLELSEISGGIKQTAKDLKIPIIALAQLSRKVEERTGSRPQMADLRESGTLEQDADVIGLIYRPEYYVQTDEKRAAASEKAGLTLETWEKLAELIIAKQRNGPVGSVNLQFEKEFARFGNSTAKLYSGDDEERQQ